MRKPRSKTTAPTTLKTKLVPFEFEVLKQLKSLNVNWSSQRLLVAYSGGRDSSVLVNLLLAMQSRLKFEVALAHVHHGITLDKKIKTYRKQAAKKAATFAKKNNLDFFLLKYNGVSLNSESEFRKAREELLSQCRTQNNCDWIVFGHHADDLLETRLIRLIRGTGAQGLQAMSFAHQFKLRPLLLLNLSQILDYADQQKLKWLEDPSNSEDHYFRNWIRNQWLPALEQKRKGSKLALSRSLDQISQSVSLAVSHKQKVGPQVIARKEFTSLNVVEKRETLARLMLQQGARDFSRRQIDEILKRLSSPRGSARSKMSFEVGGLKWQVNAEQIEAVRL